MKHNHLFKRVLITGSLSLLCGCTQMSNLANPFYESPKPVALLGEANDKALNGEVEKIDTARAALEAMASYDRTHLPQPNNPVLQPSVVRLMWVPDHVNRNGDLVPAHYYYLKVLDDRWAVQDAFELEGQLNGPKGGNNSNVPYILSNEKISN